MTTTDIERPATRPGRVRRDLVAGGVLLGALLVARLVLTAF